MNNIIYKIKNDDVIKLILPHIKGVKAWLVGGYIRDILIGNESFDRDIILIHDDMKGFTHDLADKINASFIELDKEWGIYRLVLEDKVNYIDFARAIENDIEKDLKRRDITINSMALNLETFEILDLNNGFKDIENKIIRGITEENFTDDPLRLLRVFRFKSMLGYKIDEETLKIVKKHARLIEKPAKERINTELLKLFEGKDTAAALLKMDTTGILEYILPFVKEIKKIPPNTHHHLDLLHHCIETTNQVEKNFNSLQQEAQNILNEKLHGNVNKKAFLKLAAFMHDIGKPQTWKIEPETGRHRFIMHDDLGSKLAKPILKDLKFSKKQISYIQKIIKNHIYPSTVDISNEKSVMKFLRKLGEDTPDIILLAMADRISARGEAVTEEMIARNFKNLSCLLEKYFVMLEELKPLPKLLSGEEIMGILNLTPSPALGEVIKKLKNAQEDGLVTTKDEAIEFISRVK